MKQPEGRLTKEDHLKLELRFFIGVDLYQKPYSDIDYSKQRILRKLALVLLHCWFFLLFLATVGLFPKKRLLGNEEFFFAKRRGLECFTCKKM